MTTPCLNVSTHAWCIHADMAAIAVWCLLKETAMPTGTRTRCKGARIGPGPDQDQDRPNMTRPGPVMLTGTAVDFTLLTC